MTDTGRQVIVLPHPLTSLSPVINRLHRSSSQVQTTDGREKRLQAPIEGACRVLVIRLPYYAPLPRSLAYRQAVTSLHGTATWLPVQSIARCTARKAVVHSSGEAHIPRVPLQPRHLAVRSSVRL